MELIFQRARIESRTMGMRVTPKREVKARAGPHHTLSMLVVQLAQIWCRQTKGKDPNRRVTKTVPERSSTITRAKRKEMVIPNRRVDPKEVFTVICVGMLTIRHQMVVHSFEQIMV